VTVGLLHPGEMGAALGATLRDEVLWASDARSGETTRRARAAGFRDVGSVAELARASDVVLSVCPPHAALEVARSVGRAFDGIYVDANAISPATARAIAAEVARPVDGGIIGGPDEPRLYLSGADAAAVAALVPGARIVSDRVGDASALKMVYAAWTKGTAAMLLAIREVARSEGVEDALLAEWRDSQPTLPERWRRARDSAERKGWRWVAEMEEIAATFAAAGEPDGFHRAAAEVFRRFPRA
jgi:3-hydroxyisobutyrate dehydrogenase-like beta-hydroxyacid dehydrogenase